MMHVDLLFNLLESARRVRRHSVARTVAEDVTTRAAILFFALRTPDSAFCHVGSSNSSQLSLARQLFVQARHAQRVVRGRRSGDQGSRHIGTGGDTTARVRG
jgi:predicted GNAT family acetyltransferase